MNTNIKGQRLSAVLDVELEPKSSCLAETGTLWLSQVYFTK
jgi:hypothetical protein